MRKTAFTSASTSASPPVTVAASIAGWTKALAAILCILLPARVLSPVFPSATSLGIFLACLVLPVLLSRAWQFYGVPTISALVVLCLAVTPANIYLTRTDHQIDGVAMVALIVALIGFALFIWGATWARTILGTTNTALLLATGFAVQVIGRPDVWQIQPWKFGFAFPITLAILAITSTLKGGRFSIGALLLIGIVSALNDYRTYSGIALATIAIVVAKRIVSRREMRRRARFATFVVVTIAAFAIYRLVEYLAVSGLLGVRNQEVSIAQIDRGGSLLAGARLETPIFFELLKSRPFGYAPGAMANSGDFVEGGSALVASGTDEVRYLQDYIFAATIKLHSILADLWVGFGPLGILLAAAVALTLIRGILLARNDTSSVLPIFLAVLGLWHLGFSPIGTNWWEVATAAALVALRRNNHRATEDVIRK